MADDPERVALRGRIIGLYQSGLSLRAVARQMGISPATVKKWVDRHENGDLMTDKPTSGRPRCTTVDEDLEIVNAAIVSPMTKRGAAGISDEVSMLFVFVLFSFD